MKIAHIVGNRPQFIKLSLLLRAWQRRTGDCALIIHTGQHFSDNMSAIFFDTFGIPEPDHRLHIHSLSHNEMIGNMLIALDPVLAIEKPDGVIVYGDTNTTLAGALAAKKRHLPVAHIESGIRTGKEDMPEESNRYVTDRLADLNFACTYLGMENLIKEGYTSGEEGNLTTEAGRKVAEAEGHVRESTTGQGAIAGKVFNTGDLMLDAALHYKDIAREKSAILSDLPVSKASFILVTIHRVENTEDPAVLGSIIQALNIIHTGIPVVFPLHPRTRQLIDTHHIPVDFITTPPLGYLDMLALVQASRSVITDSGGLSREAFFFHKPTLVVMEHPFWPEILVHGRCLKAEARCEDILEKLQALEAEGTGSGAGMTGPDKSGSGGAPDGPLNSSIFGDGNAADKICAILLAAWSK
jgi:UDP-GlcNAc3NAcA epimerase